MIAANTYTTIQEAGSPFRVRPVPFLKLRDTSEKQRPEESRKLDVYNQELTEDQIRSRSSCVYFSRVPLVSSVLPLSPS
jgi:hypothetical protein